VGNCIGLIRGINVGRAKRIAMADLRRLVLDLGHTQVRTLLNSGNVIFESKRSNVAKIAAGIEAAIAAKCGFSASVTVITAQDLNRIVEENPLLRMATDHARHLVAFAANPKHLEALHAMQKKPWTPDALAVTQHAAYLWCSAGILESKLSKEFARCAGAKLTSRNWATVLKLQAAARETT
jgi:uncharacterized protein (DUF1697 family)